MCIVSDVIVHQNKTRFSLARVLWRLRFPFVRRVESLVLFSGGGPPSAEEVGTESVTGKDESKGEHVFEPTTLASVYASMQTHVVARTN